MPRSKFGTFPQPHNVGSKFQTPASLIIDAHYANLQLQSRWTWDRFARLCQFVQFTPHELASTVQIPHVAIERYKQDNVLRCQGCAAYLLLLTLFEAHVCRAYTSDVIENPFPNLNALS